jgi:hypothetical protein
VIGAAEAPRGLSRVRVTGAIGLWPLGALPASLLGATLVSWGLLGESRGVQRAWFCAFAALGLAAFLTMLRGLDCDRGRREPWHDRPWHLRPHTILGLAFACQLAALPARPLTSRDALANLTYGRIMERGGDPFVTTPRAFFSDRVTWVGGFSHLIDWRWRDTPCAYGPVVAALDTAAVRIGVTPAGALAIFKVMTAIAALLGLLAAWLVAADTARPTAAFALLGLNPLYAWELAGQSHNDAFVVPLVALFAWAVRRNNLVAAAITAGVSFLVKPVLLPVYVLWVVSLAIKRRWRGLAIAATTPPLVVMLGWLPFWTGPGTMAMAVKSLVGGHVGAANSLSEALIHLAAFTAPDWNAPLLPLTRGLGLAVAAWFAVRAIGRVNKGADVIDEGLVVMLVLMGVVAWFQPWYLTWALPLAVVIRDRSMALLTGVYAATFMLTYVTGVYGSSWFVHAGMLAVLAHLRRSCHSTVRVPTAAAHDPA